MRSAFALRIISGRTILNFGLQESLRTFLYPIFTERGSFLLHPADGFLDDGVGKAAALQGSHHKVCLLYTSLRVPTHRQEGLQVPSLF